MTCEFKSSTDNAVGVLSATQQLLTRISRKEFIADDEHGWKAK
jgi:hypothetical protein